MEKELKIAVTYCRVSTSLQEEQKTIDNQSNGIKEFADEKNYKIIKEYKDEGWSGDVLERPALDQLRLDAKNAGWDAVIIYDPDRLARRYTYQEIVMDELMDRGVETLFVTTPPIKNENDQLLYEMRGSFARYERTKIAERFRMGKINRVKNNQILTSEAPYGYNYIPNKGKRGSIDYVSGHYEINEEEKNIVIKIFKWVADDKYTLKAVIRELDKLGIKPRKSKRGVWSTSTLSRLLKNESYIGLAHWGATYATVPLKPLKLGKYKKIKKTSRKDKPRSQWLFVDVPPIIDKETFEKAGLQMKKNFEMLGRNKKNNYLLSGLIMCNCGCRRTGEGVQRGEKKHLYYRCNDRVNSFPLPQTCHEGGINASITDDLLWDALKTLMTSPELLNEKVSKFLENQKKDVSMGPVIDVGHLKSEISKLKVREDKYAHLYSLDSISFEQFEEYVSPLRTKIREYESKIQEAGLEKNVKDDILVPTKEEIEEFTRVTSSCLENADFGLRQTIVKTSFSLISADRKSLQTFGKINLNEIYVALFTKYRHRRPPKRR